MTTATDANAVEGGCASDAPCVPTDTSLAAVDASLSAASNDVYLCSCCFVWEVSRGPHAGEHAEFSVRNAASTTTLLRIGRHAQCWLRLNKDLEVSGFHVELRVARGDDAAWKMLLRDDKSTNGTKINGEMAEKRMEYEVKHQDLLVFGRSAVRVTRGSTRCPLAVRGDSQEPQEKTGKHEPTAEPEPPRPQDARKTETEPQAEGVSEEPVIEEVVLRDERQGDDEDDAFEEPVRAPVVPAPASRRLSVCMVCGQELSAWSMLEQQLHVNACLDKANGVAPATSTTSVAVRRGAGESTAAAKGRKRKRHQTTLSTQPHDEELAVALALSKSLVGKEQQVEMDMALVSSELAQVDAQLAKLQKKRLTLIKKLERLEKTKRKVHTGDVHSPEEVRAMMDLNYALRVLFPEPCRARETDAVCTVASPRAGIVRLLELYRGEQAKMAATSGAEYVAMWTRASQQAWEDETEMFTNQLMRELLVQAEKTATETKGVVRDPGDLQADVEFPQRKTEPAERVETAVPDAVKRVFPEWEDNLAFLKTQSVGDLRTALDELRQTRVERQLGKVIQAEDGAGDGKADDNSVDAPSGQENNQVEDEEELACAFFEQEMIRLIQESEREELPEVVEDASASSGDKDVEIVELMDSENDDVMHVELEAQRSGDDDMECTARGSARESHIEKAAEDLSQSSDEDEPTASGENSPLVEQAEDVVADKDDQPTNEPDQRESIPVHDLEDGRQEVSEQEADEGDNADEEIHSHDEASPARDNPPHPPAVRTTADADPLEMKLLDALKANASFYEAVLLLQPLDLHQFLVYVREDARIKCAKTELVRFCDRHGITFQQS